MNVGTTAPVGMYPMGVDPPISAHVIKQKRMGMDVEFVGKRPYGPGIWLSI